MHMKRPTFIFFDIGNVIYNFQNGLEGLAKITGSNIDTCTSVWRKLDNDVCRGIRNPQDIWTELKNVTKFKGEDINFIDYWASHFKPIKATHSLIRNLSAEYPIGIMTNIYKGSFEKAIQNKSIPDIEYKAIIKSCDIGIIKPEIAIFKYAEEITGMSKETILLIDDSELNLETAKKFNWSVFKFSNRFSEVSVQGIDHLIHG
jgi:FMN phosphatase YigB (HAD superfamily)